MKRDWDLIREVLIEVEALSDKERLTFSYGNVSSPDDAERLRASHAALLLDAGYLTGHKAQCSDPNPWPIVLLPNLTWSGHDLLQTLRSKPLWEKIKDTAQEKSIELTFDSIKALAVALLPKIISGGS